MLKMTTRQGIDHLVETETHHTEVDDILVKIIGKIIEGDHEIIIGMTIEETTIENKGIDKEVEVETIAEIQKVLGMTICEVEALVEIAVE